ncbi:hypothetical protein [Arthrobacter sp. NPDC057259]|uniref:hypothetical protein n=1 Tax=Arthrobacter sp. NPDC057259 TaxID=3346073 RepID=UPI00363963DB
MLTPLPDVSGLVPVYARVEEVDINESSVLLDCVPADAPDLVELMAEPLRELRQRWKVSFGRGDAPDVRPIDLSNVPAAVVTAGVEQPLIWQELADDSTWVQVQVPRMVFSSEAEASTTISVAAFQPVSPEISGKLSAILDMNYWPRVPAPRLSEVLDAFPMIHGAVVHDVGQGSANAFFDSSGKAVLYFDAGKGSYRNAKTAPASLDLCACKTPMVVLSHWDTDHWKAAKDGNQELLKSIWVVPGQKIRPTHAKFASSILQSGGSVYVVKRSSKPKSSATSGQHLSISYGTGKDLNNSGLVLTLIMAARATSNRYVLFFPGDAAYKMCVAPPRKVDLLVASHHGADSTGNTGIPAPKSKQHSRLVYSFGPDNSYNHPRGNAIAAHKTGGWSHAAWDQSGWNLSASSGTVRATYTPSDQKRQSIVFPASAMLQAQHFSTAHGETLDS